MNDEKREKGYYSLEGEDVEIEEFGKMDELHHYGHSKPFLGLEELCRWAEATIKRLEGENAKVRGWYVKTARQEVRTYAQLTEARKLLERVVSNMRIHDAIPPKITTDIRDFLKGGEADDDES
jgi:hypothetical protein